MSENFEAPDLNIEQTPTQPSPLNGEPPLMPR
jgi:hypothetical protein